MKTIKQTFKKSATLATIFFLFFTLNTKAQDLSGTYTIQRATDGVLNRNVGTVEIKKILHYYKGGESDNVYEYKEFINGGCKTSKIKVNGNEIEAPLADGTFKSDHTILDYDELNDGWNSWIEYANIENVYYPYLMRGHETETKALYNSEGKRVNGRDWDVKEMLVKKGSRPEEFGWMLNENAVKSTEFIKLNMAWTDNLNVSKFINGEIIAEAKSVAAWQAACKAKKPVWCFYKFDPANGVKYGKIYNYYAVNDKRGLAPKGFHISTEADFDLLQSSLETYDNYGEKEYVFTNEFKVQLGGYFNGQIFDLAEPSNTLAGNWWTSTKRVVYDGYNYRTETYKTTKEILVYEFIEDHFWGTTGLVKYQEFKKNWRIIESIYITQDEGYSVRCVKD